jgi:hypothetical protein
MIVIVQETLAAQHCMLTQVCSSLQQLTESGTAQSCSFTGHGPAPLLSTLVASHAGTWGVMLLRMLSRMVVEADDTAVVLSNKVLLADSSPSAMTPGTRHFTFRCAPWPPNS